jgi:bifunctional DNA-binding transcriptional regulator/antitoxin component of YhaV-PrlF toxin-antitoxin module
MATVQVRDRGQVTLPREIRSAYHLTDGSKLQMTPIDNERFEVRVIPARRSVLELMEIYAQEGEAPDIDAEREALGDALEAALRTGDPRP